MKTKIIIFLLSLFMALQADAQSKTRFLKIAYQSTPQSPKIMALLREQIKDQDQLNKLFSLLSDYKFSYSLYVDTKTAKSAYVLDSVNKVDKIAVFGNTDFSFYDGVGNFYTAENFMKSDFLIKGVKTDLDWVITKDRMRIGQYNCLKATHKLFPTVVLWFTPELPVPTGPAFCYGLPGLVLKVDTDFDETSLLSINYLRDGSKLEEEYRSLQDKVKAKKTIPLKEALKSKENFLNEALKGSP